MSDRLYVDRQYWESILASERNHAVEARTHEAELAALREVRDAAMAMPTACGDWGNDHRAQCRHAPRIYALLRSAGGIWA